MKVKLHFLFQFLFLFYSGFKSNYTYFPRKYFFSPRFPHLTIRSRTQYFALPEFWLYFLPRPCSSFFSFFLLKPNKFRICLKFYQNFKNPSFWINLQMINFFSTLLKDFSVLSFHLFHLFIFILWL